MRAQALSPLALVGAESPTCCVCTIPPASFQTKVPGEAGDVGFKQAMQAKWLALDKGGGEPRVVRKVGGTGVLGVGPAHTVGVQYRDEHGEGTAAARGA